MTFMSMVPLYLLSLAQLSSAVQVAIRVTPTEKVIELLRDLESNVVNESSAEASTYETYSCFCKTKTDSLSTSISNGKTSIDSLSAEIAEKTALKEDKTTQQLQAKTKIEELTASLKATEVRCQKEKAQYDASDADLTKAISSLDSAIQAMQATKATANLLTMKKKLAQKAAESAREAAQEAAHKAAIAAAMKLVEEGPTWAKPAAFLQRSSVDPSDPAYKYHSQDIISTMQQLHQEFTNKKTEEDQAFAKAEQSCNNMKADLAMQMQTTNGEITTLEGEIDALATRISQARQELIDADAMLKDDDLYLTDLTKLCETRANQWDQRSKMRADELQALREAIGILENVVVQKEGVRALVQQQVSLLQQSSRKNETPARQPVMLQGRDRRVDQHRTKALEFLGLAGQKLGSSMLSSLVARAASDPFAKVKTLIQQLVERLLAESTAEATKKGFCDTEMGKATQDRDFRHQEVLKLNAEIGELEAKEDALQLEMDALSDRLAELATTANETALLRAQDKAENMNTLADAKEGLEALTEALGILKSFYKQAAKATALSQVKASPVDEDNPGAGFDGNYAGKQAESKGILGLLEVIKSDFERTIQKTEEAEKQAAADYFEFDRSTKTEQGAKTTKHELDAADLETTQIKKTKAMEDIQANMNLLDSALRELEELKPMCVDNVMSYEERVAKREEEVAALRRALCILDPQGVEAECQEASF